MLKKLFRINLLFFFIAIFIWVFSPKPAYALQCQLSFFHRSSLVIARVENQELRCESRGVVNKFKKIMVLKGTAEDNFNIVTPARSGECPSQAKPGEIKIIVGEFAGSPPTPKFETGKTYIMSVYPRNGQVSSEYALPVCDRIFGEVSGILDPKVLLYSLRASTQPIWTSGFILVFLLSYFLGNILPSVIAFGISLIIVVALYGLLIYVLFRVIRFLVNKLKVKLKNRARDVKRPNHV